MSSLNSSMSMSTEAFSAVQWSGGRVAALASPITR